MAYELKLPVYSVDGNETRITARVYRGTMQTVQEPDPGAYGTYHDVQKFVMQGWVREGSTVQPRAMTYEEVRDAAVAYIKDKFGVDIDYA